MNCVCPGGGEREMQLLEIQVLVLHYPRPHWNVQGEPGAYKKATGYWVPLRMAGHAIKLMKKFQLGKRTEYRCQEFEI